VKTSGAINLIKATVAETTPFADVANSTPHVQLPGFSTLYTGLSGCVLLIRVRSFVSKAALIVYFMALDKDTTHAIMLNSFAQDVKVE